MSSTSVKYEFTSSLKKNKNIYLTEDRQYLYFNDLQNNYSNNSSEVKFELISLANTKRFCQLGRIVSNDSITAFRVEIHCSMVLVLPQRTLLHCP